MLKKAIGVLSLGALLAVAQASSADTLTVKVCDHVTSSLSQYKSIYAQVIPPFSSDNWSNLNKLSADDGRCSDAQVVTGISQTSFVNIKLNGAGDFAVVHYEDRNGGMMSFSSLPSRVNSSKIIQNGVNNFTIEMYGNM